MSPIGKMILINLHHSQLEAGIGSNLLEHPSIPLSYLTPTWITSIRQFLFQHNLQITMNDSPNLSTHSKMDQFIMNPLHLSRFTPIQKLDLNLVRLYLQAVTLHDLSAGTDGKTICPHKYQGARPPDFHESRTWPRQLPPSPSQVKLWSKFFSDSFLRYRFFWRQSLGPRLPTVSIPNADDIFQTPHPIMDYPDLSAFLRALSDFYRRLLYHHEQQATNLDVWRAFRSRSRLEIVTDGSLAQSIGTFG